MYTPTTIELTRIYLALHTLEKILGELRGDASLARLEVTARLDFPLESSPEVEEYHELLRQI